MSPVEVRTLGPFVNLKKVQEKCVFFSGKCLTISLQTNAGRESESMPNATNNDKHRVEGWVIRCTLI